MQTNKPEMTKNVYYAEDIKQSFYIICKGKIDEGTKPFSFSKWYGILVCVPQLVTQSRHFLLCWGQATPQQVRSDFNWNKPWKFGSPSHNNLAESLTETSDN